MRYLFVSGMFRSGSTLTAKIMDAHPDVAFASDPYRPFFNDFRDALAAKHGILKDQPKQAPMSDYFFDNEQLKMMKLILSATFDLELPQDHLPTLRKLIAERAFLTSHFIAERVNELEGKTYKQFYQSMMNLIAKCYGKGHEKVVGMKEVWSNEYASAVLKTFPGSKAIFLVRDPRAIAASFNATGRRYPALYYARQWRKLVTFAYLLKQDKKYEKDVLIIRYEDIVEDPERIGRQICDFIGVSYSAAMTDGSKFRDGRGEAWSQNSSYGTSPTITKKFTKKWKEVLSPDEMRLIEKVCYYEMKRFNYELSNKDAYKFDLKDTLCPLPAQESELADWIKPFVKTDLISNVHDLLGESERSYLIYMEDDDLEKIPEEIIESLFISRSNLEDLRKIAQKELVNI